MKSYPERFAADIADPELLHQIDLCMRRRRIRTKAGLVEEAIRHLVKHRSNAGLPGRRNKAATAPASDAQGA